MSLDGHIEALKVKHAELEKAIHQESIRPLPDDRTLHDLKRQKLRIKEELESLTHG